MRFDKLAHTSLLLLLRRNCYGSSFMATALYLHMQVTFQNVCFNIQWIQCHCPLRHGTNFDVLQLLDRMGGATDVDVVFQKVSTTEVEAQALFGGQINT